MCCSKERREKGEKGERVVEGEERGERRRKKGVIKLREKQKENCKLKGGRERGTE